MGNFDFLLENKNYKDFAKACVDAEKSMLISTINAASATRRALELCVKWVYKIDTDLSLPFRDNLSSLTRHQDFLDIIDPGLEDLIYYVIKLGNLATHTNKSIDKNKVIASLRNLFAFVDWIDYSYGDEYVERKFDESLIPSIDDLRTAIKKEETEKIRKELEKEKDKPLEVQREETPDRLQEKLKSNKTIKARVFKIDKKTEELTRKEFIDVDLELAGWKLNSNALFEVPIKGMPNKSQKGYADYVLYGKDGLPLAVVEAKKTSLDAKIGFHQALLYVECLEKEYGRRPFYFNTNGFKTYFTDDESQRIVSGFYSQDDLERLMARRRLKKPLTSYDIDKNITNRAYQIEAVSAAINSYKTNKRDALLVMATGTGKTRTAISIVDILTKKNQVKNILFLADRTALVKQAKKNFNKLLPDLSQINLTYAKRNQSEEISSTRMIFSTYQTMLNSIDTFEDRNGDRLFTVGHFDLIIIDEAHRSIYQKYKEIFDYFDAKILGLTATPRSEIDRNTYEIFRLENGIPTYAYDYEDAVNEGYLVPYRSIESVLKIPTEGIKYSNLVEEEKEYYDEIFPAYEKEDIGASAINKWLFNGPTIDLVLDELMEKGIRDSSGNEIGKTIIFAKNQRHANFIKERFDEMYPEKGAEYAQVITYDVSYVDNLIERFSLKDSLPKIAISVNMLDTGIDVPEIVNLVFFKLVFSKVMFLQMIGRGTRLCKDLFGPGKDKKDFLIFDYGDNFQRFRQEKNERESPIIEPLASRIFSTKVKIIDILEDDKFDDSYKKIRESFVKDLNQEIKNLDRNSFRVRNLMEEVERFSDINSWSDIESKDISDLLKIGRIINPPKDHELTQRFDLSMLKLELGLLEGSLNKSIVKNIRKTAKNLAKKENIKAVKDKMSLIKDIEDDEFWKGIDIKTLEDIRLSLRDLMPLMDFDVQKIYYSNFKDEIISVKENKVEFFEEDLKPYREKVEHYVKSKINDGDIISKIYENKKIEKGDIKKLEDILFKELGSRADYEKEYGDMKILRLIRSITGLSNESVNEAFADFYRENKLNYDQQMFVKAIINYFEKNGYLSMEALQREPFKSIGSITKIFKDNKKELISVLDIVNKLNEYAEVA